MMYFFHNSHLVGCRYCLCKVCSGFNCPRSSKLCGMPCERGTILECDFFTNKKSVRIYKVKKRSPAIHVEELRKLQATIDLILQEYEPKDLTFEGTLSQQLYREKKRHQETMAKIMQNARKKLSGDK